MAKIVMFDLYDTLLKGVSFDFNKGVEYLYETFFKDKCSLEEIIEYSKSFFSLYAARKEKNFARADEIRNELLEKGIILKDTREGVKWQRA